MKSHKESMRVTTSQEMREIDHIAEEEYGISPDMLMENAGRSASQILLENYPGAGTDTEILVFAGSGNNAGDAFVVARRLIGLGKRVRVFYIEPATHYRPSVEKNFQILKKLGARMTALDQVASIEAFLSQASGPFTVVDGLLGTGLKGNLEGLYADVVEVINRMKAREVMSLDIPTGVSGDTGEIHGNAVQATLTVSFGFPKFGHFLPPGAAKRGHLINVDISLPYRFRMEGDTFLLLRAPLSTLLIERDRYGHKNSFGHTLLIGGAPGRVGAIEMASRACHRMGTGLVTCATWKESFEMLTQKLASETMAVSLGSTEADYVMYRQTLPTYSSIVMGPGLGLRPEGRRLLDELLTHYRGPVVLDADALNLIAEHDLHDLLVARRAPTVLTPHPGEMARLLGISKAEVTRDVIKSLRAAVEKTHAIVLLKGAATLIGTPDGRIFLNHYPNDGMATAGSGDVLAGMIGGLLGQKMEAADATLLGVYLHSLAGGIAAETKGHRSMTAQDIIENISHAFKEIKTDRDSKLPLECRAHLL
ncbi:MAG: NAD(P)H-hydrate dehydratase [Cryobacterium sp.]|nr:NAD(P)H-hydrate dehydratase [Oligoflexia bacterium]